MTTTINGIIYSVSDSDAIVTGFTSDILPESQIESNVNISGTNYGLFRKKPRLIGVFLFLSVKEENLEQSTVMYIFSEVI